MVAYYFFLNKFALKIPECSFRPKATLPVWQFRNAARTEKQQETLNVTDLFLELTVSLFVSITPSP